MDTVPAADDAGAAKERAVKQWQGMFGKGIDFADMGLYRCLSYVYPQPEKAFQDLDDNKYAPWLLDDSAYWMEVFFKPVCRPDVRKALPEQYYLPKPGETGLVLHEWRSPKYAFKAQESGNGLLVRIVPKKHDPKKPLTAKELATLLLDVFNLPYASAEKTAAKFKLPKALSAGSTFANAPPALRVVLVSDWRDHLVGFLGQDAVYVICYKSRPGRAQLGFPFDGTWLNRGLLQKDGKTLVAPPPKVVNEGKL
jgi:hypothetical protein